MRGTGILPVSIYLRAGRMPTLLLRVGCPLYYCGQDAHSTPIHSKTDATPIFFPRFPTPDSRLPTPDSRLPNT
ncbi:MAG: hypothetical protein F6K56_39095, partial [Moorea sp. SIO3G5]|nr:hypothetical protein [Moorena sp. SIO3G5]